MRTIEELRTIANEMNKSLENLLYDMLSDAMKENERIRTELNALKMSEEEWLDKTLGGDE